MNRRNEELEAIIKGMKIIPICMGCRDVQINEEWLPEAVVPVEYRKKYSHGYCDPCGEIALRSIGEELGRDTDQGIYRKPQD